MAKNGNVSDETLALAALQALDDSRTIAQLFERYEPVIKAIAANYFVAGGDSDDVIQEGRLGLFKAMLNYDKEKCNRFKPFAILCIKRQIQTAAMSASRQKHIPLNSYISLDNSLFDDEDDGAIFEVAEGAEKNPETIIIDRENREDMDDIINNTLNTSEIEVLRLYMLDKSYKEIAQTTGKTVKAVDNTLQSIKRKLKQRIK